MNIIVKTHEGRCYCRPDTTWEREDRDLFSPDSVNSYLYTPVLFARICKAGKCIGRKFAERYYDSIGYGILLYDGTLMDGSAMAYAASSCRDQTSVLPFPMYNRVTLQEGSNEFTVEKDGSELFRTSCGSQKMIEDAVSEVSHTVSLRIGDMVAVELADPAPLAGKGELGKARDEIRITGTFCGNALFGFSIFF